MEENVEPVSEQTDRENAPVQVSRTWFQRLLRVLHLGFVSLFLFSFVLSLLLQIPLFQNWSVRQITRVLSNRLETKVEIGNFRLGWMSSLVLKDVYIEDLQQDTLLFAGYLAVGLDPNPITFFREGLVINEATLHNGHLELRKQPGAAQSNLELLLDRLFPSRKKPEKEKSDFHIRLKRLFLENVAFRNENLEGGSYLTIQVRKGRILVDAMRLQEKQLAVREIFLRDPLIKIETVPVRGVLLDTLALTTETSQELATVDTSTWRISIEDFALRNGRFVVHNYQKEPVWTRSPGMINYRHLDVDQISISVQDFLMADQVYTGQVNQIALREASGFVLKNLSAKEAIVGSKGITLNGFRLVTPNTNLGDTLAFKYREFSDFGEFSDRVIMSGHFSNAEVAIKDIIAFAKGLNNSPFFSKNREEIVRIDGRIRGRVNNLSGSDLRLSFEDGTLLEGSFSSRNLALQNEEALNLKLKRLRTKAATLRDLVPNLNLPANFDRLGRLDFQGSFTGFFVDFVAYGVLQSDIGRARLDMQMVMRSGREKASYSGQLQLWDFDLGAWTGNPNFGPVTLVSKVANGRGLNAETANADLVADIQRFVFKGYNYENARLAGELRANRFDGDFSIRDENIDFSFFGQVDFTQQVPIFDFKALINKLDLKRLNLAEERDYILAGEVELKLRNARLSDMEGEIRLHNFQIDNEGQVFRLDSAVVNSSFDNLGKKELLIRSDILEAELYGLFEIERVPGDILQYLTRYYPGFSRHLKIAHRDTTFKPANFSFTVHVLNSKGFETLIDEEMGSLTGLNLSGAFDNKAPAFNAILKAPEFQFGRIHLEDLVLTTRTRGSEGSIDMAVNHTTINERTELEPISALLSLDGDTLVYGLNYSSKSSNMLDNFNIDGRLFVLDSARLKTQIDYSTIELLERNWKINDNNSITFSKDKIEFREFTLVLDDKVISLDSYEKRGVQMSLLNLDLEELNGILNFDPMQFRGKTNVYARIKDLKTFDGISVDAITDTFRVNKDDWGVMRLSAEMKTRETPLHVYLSITKDTAQLIAEGYYNTKDLGPRLEQKTGYFDANLNIHSYPLAIAEYFIGSTVSKTQGFFDAELRFFGNFSKPEVKGQLNLFKGAMTVNFLKTRYSFDRAIVNVNNTLFDASGTILKDKYQNRATVYGGIRHNHLRNFGFSARMTTRRFLGLDTQKGDNKMFYGHALGNGEVTFSGSFQQPNIYVNAEVGQDTRLVIPVSSSREASPLSFMRYHEKDKSRVDTTSKQPSPLDIRGVNLEMDLTVNESAIMQIIFNEQAGDIIEGNGRGALRILVPRSGEFQMFGDIVIERGDYLFTLYNVINKNFTIRKGGTISWTGDPFGADINLEAQYTNLNTSVANFIQEYLVNAPEKTQSEASQNTDVDLLLKLRGDLLRPTINFDLAFPSIQGELLSYTENKLRILKQDPNELNKQVFGLIVAGQFLPADFSFQGTQIIYNTVSEFLSNQLSLLVTELFSDLIGEGQALSSVDFDIAYSQYQNVNLARGASLNRGNELQVSLKQNFFNDRLSILVGGNIGLGNAWRNNASATGAFVGNDLVIEYILNDDRSLKLRIYQKLQPDISGRILRIGSGLSYRKEFNTIGEFLRSFKKTAQKLKPEDPDT